MIHRFRGIVVQGDNSASVSNTKFHSVRSVAASALEFRNKSITEICKGMQWSNSSTYTDFYSKLHISSLSPAIIAGFKVQISISKLDYVVAVMFTAKRRRPP